jgi:hypothetical protein
LTTNALRLPLAPKPEPLTDANASEPVRDARTALAWNLLVTATTVEVVTALTGAGVPSIALKGPILRERLFPEGDEHTSADIDILVGPERWAAAESELGRLGYEPLLLDIIPGDRPNHARPYIRNAGGPTVDLHRTLLGAEAPAAVVWNVLDRNTESVPLGGSTVRALSPSGQLLHVALHAAQNGADDGRTLRYLERCIEISDETQAVDALRIGQAIEATDALALGLSLVPSGQELNKKLGITPSASVLTALKAASAPNSAHAIEWLATRITYGDRARFVLHKIFPPAAYMESSYPSAHSRGGLLVAYPARWLWLARQLRPSLLAWRQAREQSRRSNQLQ